jgi:hypothetical protein
LRKLLEYSIEWNVVLGKYLSCFYWVECCFHLGVFYYSVQVT